MFRTVTFPPPPRTPEPSETATPMVIDGGEGHDRPITRENGKQKRDFDASSLEGLCCPICLEPWASQGDHQTSCLPCGHVYGMSCIIRWIQMSRGHSTKCPQCNAKCILKDVRKLYASPVVVHDLGLQKKIGSLEAENNSLKTELLHQSYLDSDVPTVMMVVCYGSSQCG
uniref:RING-type domain-containing protein n=1 Tax=Fagus sylvatica TaxID=28930 RepID=A0A2N9FGT2_FAGSY